MPLGNVSYADFNIKELKECLRARGLKVLMYTGPSQQFLSTYTNAAPAHLTGNKPDLISRLQEYDDEVGDDGSEASDTADSGPTERYCPSSHPTRIKAVYIGCSALAPSPFELFPAQGQRCHSPASSADDC